MYIERTDSIADHNIINEKSNSRQNKIEAYILNNNICATYFLPIKQLFVGLSSKFMITKYATQIHRFSFACFAFLFNLGQSEARKCLLLHDSYGTYIEAYIAICTFYLHNYKFFSVSFLVISG